MRRRYLTKKDKKVVNDLHDLIIAGILYLSIVPPITKMIDNWESHLIYSYCVNNETVVMP